MGKKTLVYGTVILTISSMMTRLVGLIFRIYLSNTIGAEGMGLFQIVFSFYSLAITLATAGISTAVSRLVAEQMALDNIPKVKKIMRSSIGLSVVLSLSVATIVFLFSDKLSLYFLKDARTSLSLMAFAPSLVFIAVSSCIKGYYYATNDVAKPASSEFVEQVIRMGFIGIMLKMFASRGIDYACAAVLFGYTVGELASLLYLYLFYLYTSRKKLQGKTAKQSAIGNILAISLPIAFSSCITSLLRTEENLLILSGLQKFGGSYESAISTYGVLSGMVLPTLMFPSAFLIALSTTIIPNVSKANVRNDQDTITRTVSKVLQFTSLIGVLIVSVFLTFPDELGVAVYNNLEVGSMLKMLAFICPLIYLEIVVSGILNALGHQVSSSLYNIIDSIIRLVLIYIFVPRFGFIAFLCTMIFSNVFTSMLCMRKLSKVSKISFKFVDWILKPSIATTACILNIRVIYYTVLSKIMPYNIALIVGIVICAILYVIVNYIVGSFSAEDIKLIKNMYKKKTAKNAPKINRKTIANNF